MTRTEALWLEPLPPQTQTQPPQHGPEIMAHYLQLQITWKEPDREFTKDTR